MKSALVACVPKLILVSSRDNFRGLALRGGWTYLQLVHTDDVLYSYLTHIQQPVVKSSHKNEIIWTLLGVLTDNEH